MDQKVKEELVNNGLEDDEDYDVRSVKSALVMKVPGPFEKVEEENDNVSVRSLLAKQRNLKKVQEKKVDPIKNKKLNRTIDFIAKRDLGEYVSNS